MSNLKKILVVNDYGPSYFSPFAHLGLPCTLDHEDIDTPEEIALVVFTGGDDVSPYLYNASKHPSTGNSLARDIEEIEIFEKAEAAGIPMAGICRGSQFLCVMAGGKLVQNISNHCVNHDLVARYPNGVAEIVPVTSSHHQMQYPFDLPAIDYDIIAWSSEQRSDYYSFDAHTTVLREDASKKLKMEPDVVFYTSINALAAQYHPEWMVPDSKGFRYFKRLVDHYLVPLMEARNESIDRRKKATSASC